MTDGEKVCRCPLWDGIKAPSPPPFMVCVVPTQIHINLLAIEARKQAILLFALRAVKESKIEFFFVRYHGFLAESRLWRR